MRQFVCVVVAHDSSSHVVSTNSSLFAHGKQAVVISLIIMVLITALTKSGKERKKTYMRVVMVTYGRSD